jgi:hypothetical protein
MSNYPFSLDDDSTIIRVDDDVTQLGGLAIDQCRSAIFAIENEIGIGGSGAVGSIAARLEVSIDPYGYLRPSAILHAISVTQFTDAQIAPGAGIQESKIALAYSTQSLYNDIQVLGTQINAVQTLASTTQLDFIKHITGVGPLSGGESGRHVVSHIDINAAPTDPRDPSFTWPGGHAPTDRNGLLRGSNLALFLFNINQDLVSHELADGNVHTGNIPNQYGHVGAGISLNSTNFVVIPKTVENVQEFANFVDTTSFIGLTIHQQDEHGNNIPRTCRGTLLNSTDDGYTGSSQEIVPFTLCKTFLHDNGSGGNAGSPVDNNTYGDDVIQFIPPQDPTFNFDSMFSSVKPGQIITVNYGTVQAQYIIESARASYDGYSPPNRSYYVRINGRNIIDSSTAVARIDAPIAVQATSGVMALAQTNNTFDALPSVTVSDPRAASALGIDFTASEFGPTNYNLYLAVYPTGNPTDRVQTMPPIDVTGNQGTTPGAYTIDTIIAATNDAFAAPGYNYRFIAYQHDGNFGIAMTDATNGAGFSVINGTVSTGGVLGAGSFSNNVIGDALGGPDPLGLGKSNANVASPPYQSSFASIQQAQFPTQIFLPLVNKNYYVNGQAKSSLNTIEPADGYFDVNGDGYWMGSIISKTITPGITVRATYNVNQDLSKYGLTPGKTILIQPLLPFSSPAYNDTDYGRFIIDSISFTTCDSVIMSTTIEVYSCIYAVGTPVSVSSTGINVAIYYSENSIGFDALNLVNATNDGSSFKRYFEFFVDSTGHTFSSERARVNLTTGDANLVRFNIIGVGPKLRGYSNNIDNLTNSSTSILFNLTAWNATTGIFSGNLCNTISSNLGATITGKQGEVVRFYDETGIDYIDMIVNLADYDALTVPISFNPPSVPVQLNIDLFPSLRLDSQVFYLGAGQLNGSNQQITFIQDGRQFGGVTENELSTSALQYIAAAPANVSQNGVLRGLALNSHTALAATFQGGAVLVNGVVKEINNFTVNIPAVQDNNGGTPINGVNWVICVNQKAEIQTIPITDYDTTVNAINNPGRLLTLYNPTTLVSYPVDSTTFSSLLNTRKDLTPLYLFNQQGASAFVTDVRKFIRNSDQNISPVLSADPSTGNFSQFAVVNAYLKYNSSYESRIKVKGSNSILGALTLSYPQPVDFIGDGAGAFVFQANSLFDMFSVANFENITFTFLGGGFTGLAFQAGSVSTFNNCTFNDGYGINFFEGGQVTFNNCTFNFGTTLAMLTNGGNVTFNNCNIIFAAVNTITISSGMTMAFNGCTMSLAPGAFLSFAAGSFASFKGCTITVNGQTGFNVKSNTTFDGCNITYNYDATNDATWSSSYLVNCTGPSSPQTPPPTVSSATYGAIAGLFSDQTIQNIYIRNCKFTTTTVNRYPVISFYAVQANAAADTFLSNFYIENNQFISTTSVDDLAPAFALLTGHPAGYTSGNEAPKLINCHINKNYCDKNQMIFLGAQRNGSSPGSSTAMINVHIENNVCGAILYWHQLDYPRNTPNLSQLTRDKDETLIIAGNSCHLIATACEDGLHRYQTGGDGTYWIGSTIIRENTVNWVQAQIGNNDTTTLSTHATTLQILNNRFLAYSTTFLGNYIGNVDALEDRGTPSNSAIRCDANSGSGGDVGNVKISGNMFFVGSHTDNTLTPQTIYYYDNCVFMAPGGSITDNTFDGCLNQSGTGTFITYYGVNGRQCTITGNQFYRYTNVIASYINVTSSSGLVSVTGNFFDSETVDGASNYTLVVYSNSASLIRSNLANLHSYSENIPPLIVPVVRNICQPAIWGGYVGGASVTYGYSGNLGAGGPGTTLFSTLDGTAGSAGQMQLAISRFPNGSTMNSFNITYALGHPGKPWTAGPSISLYAYPNNQGASTPITLSINGPGATNTAQGATFSWSGTTPSVGTYVCTIPGGLVLDDSSFSYILQIQSPDPSGLAYASWAAPIINVSIYNLDPTRM